MMLQYAETTSCRRRFILNYFGENFTAASCGACENCLQGARRDATRLSRLRHRRCRLSCEIRARHGRTRREGPRNRLFPSCRVQNVAGFGRFARAEDRLIAPGGPCCVARSRLSPCMGSLVAVLAGAVSAQINPPAPAPSGPVNPAIPPAEIPAAAPSPVPEGAPAAQTSPVPVPAPAPGESASPEVPATASPAPTPTPPPILVDPATPSVEPGRTATVRVNGAAGTLTVTTADPAIATATVDQVRRTIFITGVAVGSTIVTVGDAAASLATSPVRVAYCGGAVASTISLRVTGDPASVAFLRNAASRPRKPPRRCGRARSIYVPTDAVAVRNPLPTDDRTSTRRADADPRRSLHHVNGTTHISTSRTAPLPRIAPSSLLVSDYPERLTADGVLFTATIDRTAVAAVSVLSLQPRHGTCAPHPRQSDQRGARRRRSCSSSRRSPDPGRTRWRSATPRPLASWRARVQQRGHRRHDPGGRNRQHRQPRLAGRNAVVNGILQLREVERRTARIALVAQNADAPLDAASADAANLLSGGAPHARGIYPVPEFFSEYTFFTDAPPLEIPIGQFPLPNSARRRSARRGLRRAAIVARRDRQHLDGPPQSDRDLRESARRRRDRTFIIDDMLVQVAPAAAVFALQDLARYDRARHTFARCTIVDDARRRLVVSAASGLRARRRQRRARRPRLTRLLADSLVQRARVYARAFDRLRCPRKNVARIAPARLRRLRRDRRATRPSAARHQPSRSSSATIGASPPPTSGSDVRSETMHGMPAQSAWAAA